MGSAGILLIGRSISNVAVDNDQRWPVARALKGIKRPFEHIEVVRVTHSCHIPVVAQEPRRDIFTERPLGVPFDGDLVVVINPAKI